MRIVFIRHGEPDYSKDSLTPKGWREAELLAKRISKWNVSNVKSMKGMFCQILLPVP